MRKNAAYADVEGSGNDEIKKRLAEIFASPNTEQLMMTSILGRGEIYIMAEGLTRQSLFDPARYEYDENDKLKNHIPLSKIHLENILRLKMSQGGKNREYLTYLAEQEMYDLDDDMSNKPFKRA